MSIKKFVQVCVIVILCVVLWVVVGQRHEKTRSYEDSRQTIPPLTAEPSTKPVEGSVASFKVLRYTYTSTPKAPSEAIVEPVEEKSEELQKLYTDEDAKVIAQMLWGEARGIADMVMGEEVISREYQLACTVWSVVNRYDYGYSSSISGVVSAPYQYHGYNSNNPVDEELLDISYDVLDRWNREKQGGTDVGRVLPPDYMWFYGDGKHNYFRNAYDGGVMWDWSMADPYI